MSRPIKSKTENKELPKVEEGSKPLPKVTDTKKEVPETTDTQIPAPKIGNQENCVQFGDDYIEIKPTKLKYQRDRTAAAYRILQQISVTELLALQDGLVDPDRSSDKVLFDWLIAVTDDSDLVIRNYDKLDSETIYQCLKIFCRLNHIKEEDSKKDQAQMTD